MLFPPSVEEEVHLRFRTYRNVTVPYLSDPPPDDARLFPPGVPTPLPAAKSPEPVGSCIVQGSLEAEVKGIAHLIGLQAVQCKSPSRHVPPAALVDLFLMWPAASGDRFRHDTSLA